MTITQEQFHAFANAAFAEGAISRKNKELMAFAIAHATRSQRCIEGHTRRAVRLGATHEELTEAMWVGIAMLAGAGLPSGGKEAEATIERATRILNEQQDRPSSQNRRAKDSD